MYLILIIVVQGVLVEYRSQTIHQCSIARTAVLVVVVVLALGNLQGHRHHINLHEMHIRVFWILTNQHITILVIIIINSPGLVVVLMVVVCGDMIALFSLFIPADSQDILFFWSATRKGKYNDTVVW